MNGKWLSMVVLVAAAGLLLGLNSCAHDQQLVSIEVQPAVENVGSTSTPVPDDAGFQVQLRALGTYIHPPVTKDITNQVTWASNTSQMFTVNSTGLMTATGESCGGTLVSATAHTNTSAGGIGSSGAVVTGYMTANVVCYTGTRRWGQRRHGSDSDLRGERSGNSDQWSGGPELRQFGGLVSPRLCKRHRGDADCDSQRAPRPSGVGSGATRG